MQHGLSTFLIPQKTALFFPTLDLYVNRTCLRILMLIRYMLRFSCTTLYYFQVWKFIHTDLSKPHIIWKSKQSFRCTPLKRLE